jgi:phage-related protein
LVAASLHEFLTIIMSQITLVVRDDLNSMNTVFDTAMRGISSEWSSTIQGGDGLIEWRDVYGMISRTNFFSHGTVLSTIPNTISYMW